MVSVRKSLVLSVLQRNGTTLIQLLATMVLARVLSPAEFGIYAIGAAAMALAQSLRDFGVAQYLVQERELTPDRIRTALGVSILIAWTLAASLYGLSDPVARYYDQEGLGGVLRVLSMGFVVLPLSAPALALLRRDLNFDKLIVIGIGGALAQAGSSIGLAFLGFSYMSLAWGSVVNIVVIAVLASCYRPDLIRLGPSLREWRRVAGFGIQYSVVAVLSEIGSATPNLVVGKVLGMEPLGILARGRAAVRMFNRVFVSAIQVVALPSFAKQVRQERGLRDSYLTGISHMSCVTWSFLGLCAVFAFPVIRLLLGDQWDGAVPIVQILCINGIFLPFLNLNGALFIATGRIKTHMYIQCFVQPLRVLVVVVAAPYGLIAVACAMLLPPVVNAVLAHRVLTRTLGYSIRELFASVRSSALVAAATLCVPVAALLFFGVNDQTYLWFLFVLGPLSAVVWLVSLFVFRHPLEREVRAMFEKARSMRTRKK